MTIIFHIISNINILSYKSYLITFFTYPPVFAEPTNSIKPFFRNSLIQRSNVLGAISGNCFNIDFVLTPALSVMNSKICSFTPPFIPPFTPQFTPPLHRNLYRNLYRNYTAITPQLHRHLYRHYTANIRIASFFFVILPTKDYPFFRRSINRLRLRCLVLYRRVR